MPKMSSKYDRVMVGLHLLQTGWACAFCPGYVRLCLPVLPQYNHEEDCARQSIAHDAENIFKVQLLGTYSIFDQLSAGIGYRCVGHAPDPSSWLCLPVLPQYVHEEDCARQSIAHDVDIMPMLYSLVLKKTVGKKTPNFPPFSNFPRINPKISSYRFLLC